MSLQANRLIVCETFILKYSIRHIMLVDDKCVFFLHNILKRKYKYSSIESKYILEMNILISIKIYILNVCGSMHGNLGRVRDGRITLYYPEE